MHYRAMKITMYTAASELKSTEFTARGIRPRIPAITVPISKAHHSKQIINIPGSPNRRNGHHSLRLDHDQPYQVLRWRPRILM